MDIAEIRKKAQARSNAGELEQASAAAQVPEAGPQPADSPAEAPLDELQAAAGMESPPVVQPGDSAGLDQLFAMTEEFALATDESYADLMNNQVESEDLTNQYLAFNLGDEEYALDIRRISEIIKVREFTDIPRAPEFILGIISLRGVVVPVYDLRSRLSLGCSEITSASRIVVCQLADVSVGFLVDSINQVVKLSDRELEPPPGVLSGLDREMVAGIGRFQGRMIILLNLQSVLDVEI